MEKYIALWQTALGIKFFALITYLGSFVFILGGALAVMFWLVLRSRKFQALVFGAGITVAGLLTRWIKVLTKVERPTEFSRIPETGYSFPSQHAVGAMIFYGFLLFLIYRHAKNGLARKLSSFVLLSLILLVGFSRIYLGAHWASDVLAGWFLGGIILSAMIAALKIKEQSLRANKNQNVK